MDINLQFRNCDKKNAHPDPYSVDGEVLLDISFSDNIPTVQSRNHVKDQMVTVIQQQLSQIAWIAIGPVWVELTWYIDAAHRQETDVVGDLDNISKQVIDSLTGLGGLFVDDSQMKTFNSCWLAKNQSFSGQRLSISVRFLSDETLLKDIVFFIQYNEAMCFAIDLNPNVESELKAIKLFAKAKMAQRNTSRVLQEEHNVDLRFELIASQKDFHRTRLRSIPAERIFRL
ncbi:RusA family crossover junction endodeoxyribonuclease [Sphingobacterium sp. R2]|uniref:RusA family crossover junction endodeoxyribonuclease n=1 Tax=Sphingobacterium sp. R2 TaxID=3112958 RepID=UPI00345C8075